MKNNVRVYGLLLMMAAGESLSAQVVLSGTNYIQNFDGISSGLPPGWSVRTNATGSTLGSDATFVTNATSWGSTAGQFANYASTLNNGTNFIGTESTAIQSACTNRSLGLRQTGSFGDPGAAFVLQLQNTVGFRNFQLNIDLNMLSVQTRSNAWIIDYAFGNSPGAFTPVWTNSDPGIFGAMPRAISFGSALDDRAQAVWIRVVALDPAAGGGSRDTFGVDNFKLSFEPATALSPIPLAIQLNGTNAILAWTNAAFGLQSAPALDGSFTDVNGASSPYTNPISATQKYFRLKRTNPQHCGSQQGRPRAVLVFLRVEEICFHLSGLF